MKFLALAMAALAMNSIAAADGEPQWTKSSAAPDGKIALVKAWDRGAGNLCEVSVRDGKKLLCQYLIQPDEDVRDVRFSWSPDSRALLVGENCKAVMNLRLVRFAEGQGKITYFDCDDAVNAPMLHVLPFRQALQNSAPNAWVAWHTVQWGKPGHCDMIYVFHGIGYEGEATLRIDWEKQDPKLIVLKISPILNPKNFNDL